MSDTSHSVLKIRWASTWWASTANKHKQAYSTMGIGEGGGNVVLTQSFAFCIAVCARVVLSNSSFFGVIWIWCCGGRFLWQQLLLHIWHLIKWFPKPRGPHRAQVLLISVEPAKDVEKHREEGMVALCHFDEAWFAIAEFVRVPPKVSWATDTLH